VSPRQARKRRAHDRWYGPLGLLALVLLLAGVYISYNANSGVPGQSSYEFRVDVADADRLVKTNQVRMAGVRVGQIKRVEVVPAKAGTPDPEPRARITVSLQQDTDPIPVDTRVKVRPASILGASYLDLVPGKSRTTVPEGGLLALANSSANVELTDLLDVFDRGTSQAIQGSITSVGGGLAGRGEDFGQTIVHLADAARPVKRVADTLADPASKLAPLIGNFDTTITAFGGVRDEFGRLMRDGSRTFSAMANERDSLARLIDELPASAATTTRALRGLRPALDDIAAVSLELRPGAERLPDALRSTDGLFRAALPTLRTVPRFSTELSRASTSISAFGRNPSTDGVIRRAGDVLVAGGPLFDTMAEAQVYCNVVSLFGSRWIDNFGTLGTGDGPSLANINIKSLGGGPTELLQNPKPLDNLHANYNPIQNRHECEAGNEPYDPTKQSLSNPPGLQSNETAGTSTDPKVVEHARRAGLLAPPPEDR
jgi:virulence factor Mce-like protein